MTAPAMPLLPPPVRAMVACAKAQYDEAEATIHAIVAAAFAPCRMPRSAEYRAGVTALLMHRALGARLLCPHANGSAQADAWYAGVDEGIALWRHQVVEQLATRMQPPPAVTKRAARRRSAP